MNAAELVFAARFGYGLAEGASPETPERQLSDLDRPDPAEGALAAPPLEARMEALAALRATRLREERGDPDAVAARQMRRDIRAADLRRLVGLPVLSRNGLRERLTAFWADHFAVSARNRELELLAPHLPDAAIRPNLGGTFAAMLTAAALHPAMLLYLDQNRSVGPASAVARKTPGRGMNENLARELLELHTLGVGASYAQRDVAELARLLAGASLDADGFAFDLGKAEPGEKQVIGGRWGGGPLQHGLADIEAALAHLATHPETARHLAHKMAAHFVAPEPPADLVRALEGAWLESGGHLGAVHRALIEHPAAAGPLGARLRRPVEHMAACLRALGAAPPERPGQIAEPLARMGQPAFEPPGPDGWPEDEAAWLAPAAFAERIAWSFDLAARAGGDRDPRAFLEAALGPLAPPTLRAAVAGAETRAEGLGLVLVSPAFMRR